MGNPSEEMKKVDYITRARLKEQMKKALQEDIYQNPDLGLMINELGKYLSEHKEEIDEAWENEDYIKLVKVGLGYKDYGSELVHELISESLLSKKLEEYKKELIEKIEKGDSDLYEAINMENLEKMLKFLLGNSEIKND